MSAAAIPGMQTILDALAAELCPSCRADVLRDDPHRPKCPTPAAKHERGDCGINCESCAEEIARDEAPGGQCFEGTCYHDDCIRERREGADTVTALEAKAPAGMNPRWAAWLATEPETVQPWAFGIWIHARWREWQAETGRRSDARPTANEHDVFDEWLAAKVYGCGSNCNAPIGSDEPRDHTACLDVTEALEAVRG